MTSNQSGFTTLARHRINGSMISIIHSFISIIGNRFLQKCDTTLDSATRRCCSLLSTLSNRLRSCVYTTFVFTFIFRFHSFHVYDVVSDVMSRHDVSFDSSHPHVLSFLVCCLVCFKRLVYFHTLSRFQRYSTVSFMSTLSRFQRLSSVSLSHQASPLFESTIK